MIIKKPELRDYVNVQTKFMSLDFNDFDTPQIFP